MVNTQEICKRCGCGMRLAHDKLSMVGLDENEHVTIWRCVACRNIWVLQSAYRTVTNKSSKTK